MKTSIKSKTVPFTGHSSEAISDSSKTIVKKEQISISQLTTALEKQAERHLSLAVSVFQNLDAKILLQPSATGGWSIAQCLWHLNSYGTYYLPLIKKALENAPYANDNTKFNSGFIGGFFIQMMEQTNKKYKAAPQHIPVSISDPLPVVAVFIQQQEDLIQLLRIAGNKDLSKISIPVSIMKLIKLRTGDILKFIVTHNERHIQQAQRNLK